MALKTLPTTRSEHRVVMAEDPDVTPKSADLCGWIPASDATVASGASIVTVRPLDVDERAQVFDSGFGSLISMKGALAACRAAVVEVDGRRDRKDIRRFFESCHDDPVTLLGYYIRSITNGDDPQVIQRAMLGREAAPSGDSKSGGVEA